MSRHLTVREAMDYHLTRRLSSPAFFIATALILATMIQPARAEASSCAHYASPSGVDSSPGTRSFPFRSVARLIGALEPGEDGCLISGERFVEPIGSLIIKHAGGTATEPILIRGSNPRGPAPRIHGQWWIQRSASNIVFKGIHFEGSPSPITSTMLIVDGDGVRITESELTFSKGICIDVGGADQDQGSSASDIRVRRFVLQSSRVHGCGTHPEVREKFQNTYESSGGSRRDSGVHGIYLVAAERPKIRNNYVYDNIDRGIQLYPDVDGGVIKRNVIDGNGSGIHLSTRSDHGRLSEGNLVARNVISNSSLRANDPSVPWWPAGDSHQFFGFGFPGPAREPGTGGTFGNSVKLNCFGGVPRSLSFGGWGYGIGPNTFSRPRFRSRRSKDFRLRRASHCDGAGPRRGARPPAEFTRAE